MEQVNFTNRLPRNSLLFYVLCYVLCAAFVFFSFESLGQSNRLRKPISIGVSEIDFLLTKSPQTPGPYNTLLNKMKNVNLVFAPPGRAGILWDNKEVNCLFPGSSNAMPNKSNFVMSEPAFLSNAFLFSNTPYTTIDEFKFKRIAIRRGFSYGNIRDQFPATYVELETEAALVEFLLKNRVDAMIAYITDTYATFRDSNHQLPFYLQAQPVYQSVDAFLCHKNKQNIQFIKSANAVIHEWKKLDLMSSILPAKQNNQ